MENQFLSTFVSTDRRSKTMKTSARAIAIAFTVGAAVAPLGASAFESGSTGADGAFNPTVNTTVPLPPSGIFNYTSVNIPVGVTVTFQKNTTNTPVVILASGNVTIAGAINISGTNGVPVGAAGGGALGDDGTPGLGGPGGFDGGRGGIGGTFNAGTVSLARISNRAGAGLGPGGGGAGATFIDHYPCAILRTSLFAGAGGAYAAAASNATGPIVCTGTAYYEGALGGGAYGTSTLLPLIGGSGGGGGGGGTSGTGAGGGGGGGALLIAASGTVSVTGSISANGGNGGDTDMASNTIFGTAGGGGSGGAIRIVATAISGNGAINAFNGNAGSITNNCCSNGATAGTMGRIRLESETFARTAATSPPYAFSAPSVVFVAGTPTLTISSVAGVSAPATPTGNADITLPATTPNPVTVSFTTSGVPVGNIVQLTVTPANGAKVVAVSPALTGSTASATALVDVNLPTGPSTLSAQTTYTVTAAFGDLLKNFAGNERVERVTLTATLGGPQKVMLTTVSGKEFEAPAEVLRLAALGG